MSKQNEFEYMEVKEFLNLPVIEINDVKSFTRLANANNVKHVFKITGNKKTDFFFPHAGVMYKITSEGFLTLADMQQAQNGGFPGAEEYYAAKKLGITSNREYVDVSQTGEETAEDYAAARSAGFLSGFEAFKSKYDHYQKDTHKSVIPADLDSAVKLHKYALTKEIKTYDEFEKIYDAGFPDLLAYNDAMATGFINGFTYKDARKRGFSDAKEYNEAKKLHIENKKDYEEYAYLKDLNRNRDLRYDQLQLLIALSNSDNGKIVSIAEARKMLQAAQEKLKKESGLEGNKVLPIWYTRSIAQEDKLVKFLKENEELKKFGFFNTAKNSFEIFKASAVKIYVDGSNVAHNGHKKPDLKNIRLVIKELNFWKFKNIVIFVDATLRHRIKYPVQLQDLKKEFEFYEAPSKTAADEFLIASIKREKCLIVTNDEFKDWQAKDKWVSDKIESIRVPFTISKDDKVILRRMEELREKLVEE